MLSYLNLESLEHWYALLISIFISLLITLLDIIVAQLRASSEDKADGGKLFHIDTLFGKRDDPLLHVYARQIVERIASVSSKPLLLAIALKSRDTATFQSALNHLFDINTWQ